MHDLCYRIVLDTKAVAESFIMGGDLAAYDLCVKFMNTYIRNAITEHNLHAATSAMFQLSVRRSAA